MLPFNEDTSLLYTTVATLFDGGYKIGSLDTDGFYQSP